MLDLIKKISWLGAAHALVKPLWFVFITALCMRLLGVEGYGMFSAALALAMIATAFNDLGMGRLTSRGLARDRSQAGEYLSNLFLMRTALVALSGTVALGAALLLGYRGPGLATVGFAFLYAAALQWTQYCRCVFEAYELLKLEAGLLVVEKVLVIGLGAAALVATRSPHFTLAGMAVGMVLTAAVHTAWIGQRLVAIRRTLVNRGFIRRALREMVPLGIGSVLMMLYYRVDLVMVEAILGERAAGQYGVAYRILESLNVVTAVVVIAGLYPRLSRLFRERAHGPFISLYRRSQTGLAALTLAGAAAIALLAPFLIGLLASDPGFGPSAGALRILVWAFPIFCANSLAYSALLAMDDDRVTVWILGGALVANVALNAVLIPLMGIEGAAMATVIPEFGLVLVYWFRFRRTFRRGAAA